MHHLQNNYLECGKMGRNDSRFTIVNYINTMGIIKLFWVNIFMPVTKFSCLTILLFCKRRPFQIFDQFRALLKETNNKNWGFCIGKERESKTVFLTHIGIWQMLIRLPRWKPKSLFHVSTFLPTWFFLHFKSSKLSKWNWSKIPIPKQICAYYIF